MHKPKAIILTDTVLWGPVGNSRYMGAYAVASELRSRGIPTLVIDYFTRQPDFFTYLENFLGEETVAIGISSTFLAPLFEPNQVRHRSEMLDIYYQGELWKWQPQDLRLWLETLKQTLRRRAPQAKIVLGGVKSQFAIWRPENFPHIDYIFLGHAERSFADLVENLLAGQEPQLASPMDQRLVDSAKDRDDKNCPVALWTNGDAIAKGEALPLEVARGCIFNCKFCHYEKKASYRKSIDLLRDEVVRNWEMFGVQTYSLCDDCFNDHPEKVKSICEMLLRLNFPVEWTAYARVDVAVKYPWTLELMVESGARGLYWGIESFDHEVARRAGKGTPPEKTKELLHQIHAKFSDRCLTEISFVTGLPGETPASLAALEGWLVQNPVVDLVSIGPLGLQPYVQKFDHLVFDYADYSRNPEKYGFRKVSFNPYYWEHETMNCYEAVQWAERIRRSYFKVRPRGYAGTIWAYPHLRTLGFSREQIFSFFRNPQLNPEVEVRQRFAAFTKRYWQNLLAANSAELSGPSLSP